MEDILAEKFDAHKNELVRLRKLFRAYRRAKRQQNVLDYDDLLVYWLRLLKKPDIAKQLRQRFKHVLVDEFQDTNRLQPKIRFVLKPKGQGVTVVGDDAQAIYSFRAATVENIREFPKLALDARIINLEQNYRSTNQVLKACNSVINLSKVGFRKRLWSERPDLDKPTLKAVNDDSDQARHVAISILDAKENGVPFRAQAVLMRASHPSQKLEIELARRNIPFQKWGGIKFLEAAHIKDVLGVLRWLENPTDNVATMRTFRLLPGVGPASALQLIEHLNERTNPLSLRRSDCPREAIQQWKPFVGVIKELGSICWKGSLRTLVYWYLPLMKHDNVELRTTDLHQLCILADDYATREQFLVDVTLEPPEGSVIPGAAKKESDEDHVVLSTINSAKGQEWDSVYVLNAVDGCIPSSRAKARDEFEEERRLLYVAMSRARNSLTLMVPQRVYSSRNNSTVVDLFTRRTKFIPSKLEKHFTSGVGNNPTNPPRGATKKTG